MSRSDSSDGAVPRSHSEKHCSVRSENMFQLSCYPDLQIIPTFPLPPHPILLKKLFKNGGKNERIGEEIKEEDGREIIIFILCLYTIPQCHCKATILLCPFHRSGN